jgi:fluoride ion exporter CrcB/FEX
VGGVGGRWGGILRYFRGKMTKRGEKTPFAHLCLHFTAAVIGNLLLDHAAAHFFNHCIKIANWQAIKLVALL